MQWFIDDLHLPLTHCDSTSTGPLHCSSHEYLRQLIDSKGLYNLEKKNDWCLVEDLVVFASLTSNSDALVGPRLRRHMAIVHVPDLQHDNLGVVASQQLTTLLENVVSEDTLQRVVDHSVAVYRSVKEALDVSDMPGRQHYFFSFKFMESVFQVCPHFSLSAKLYVQLTNCSLVGSLSMCQG